MSAPQAKITCLGHGGAFAALATGNTAYLVETADHKILVDCGTTVPEALGELGVDLGSLTAVVVTHLHQDHCGGLERLLYYRHYVSKAQPIQLIMGPGVWDAWLSCTDLIENDLRRHVYPLRLRRDNYSHLAPGIEVCALEVNHGGDIPNMAGYCFVLKLGHCSVFFSGDRIWRHAADDKVFHAMGHSDLIFHELELFSPPSGAHTNVADVKSGYLWADKTWWGHHGSPTREYAGAADFQLARKGDVWWLNGRRVEFEPVWTP